MYVKADMSPPEHEAEKSIRQQLNEKRKADPSTSTIKSSDFQNAQPEIHRDSQEIHERTLSNDGNYNLDDCPISTDVNPNAFHKSDEEAFTPGYKMNEIPSMQFRRSSRKTKQPSHLKDYIAAAIDVDRYEKEESSSNRLMQEFELPHCLINNDTDGYKTLNNSISALGADDLSMPIANVGRGALVRKVDYVDSMNKREWLNTIEEGVASMTNIRNGCERRGSKDDVAAKLTSRTP
ncbi:hypothetical protein GJ496_005006 [Pomphorhynchus laevis]|nr:hypothetical protein GJ496_005006 [Pomphorhynchus laevis]